MKDPHILESWCEQCDDVVIPEDPGGEYFVCPDCKSRLSKKI